MAAIEIRRQAGRVGEEAAAEGQSLITASHTFASFAKLSLSNCQRFRNLRVSFFPLNYYYYYFMPRQVYSVMLFF